ncbi:MAG: glutamine amidotransferase [Parcubacteria group bacterium Gr01-1014_8]|nr:MAG: glutamine amidotransferase [Parcubacteria group bacterium Gr01-1014_8]
MKFLVFQHVPHEHPGMLGDAAKTWGVDLTVIELWKPYIMPVADEFDALVIMGGPMGVYEGKEQYSSKDDELAFIKENLGKMSVIGFCLGGQLLAHALGSRVYPNLTDGKRQKEVGYHTVELTAEGAADPLFKGFSSPIKVLQWHGDAFDLPKDATLLAFSSACPNQAFRWGTNVYGMLFHNEFTPEMINMQLSIDKEWIHKDYEIDERALRDEARANAPLMREQCNRLFGNFCETAARH